MEVKVCKNCRRLFKYIYGLELCQDCTKLLSEEKQGQNNSNTSGDQNTPPIPSMIKSLAKDEEVLFEQVRDYIITHPKASVAQISEVNGVPPTKIFDWIRDDRLEFSDDAEYAWFNCEKCGAKIKSGRLCNRCKTK